MPVPGRGGLPLLLGVYVLPVLAAAAYLTYVGLGILAVALLAVEAVVAMTVAAVRTTPAAPRAEPSRRPWLIPVVMLGGLVLMALGTALLAR